MAVASLSKKFSFTGIWMYTINCKKMYSNRIPDFIDGIPHYLDGIPNFRDEIPDFLKRFNAF